MAVRIAILGDVHGNVAALDAALTDRGGATGCHRHHR
jgi:hypothetical protein